MFQSIKYINCIYDNKYKLHHYCYEITDSDFISNSLVAVTGSDLMVQKEAAAVIKEYESRKYTHQEIISNLFLLNMFMLKQNWYNNMSEILEYQNKYLSRKHYATSNFNEKYYNDLVKYTKKMMVIS